jgi:glycosyltransferase involved in cell wall biosynthesis
MGFDALIRAVALPQFPTAIVAVAGIGPLSAKLKALVIDLGLAERVRFLGAVPDGQLPDWYRAADAFVLPTIAYEGFGMVTAEALATGTPVVGTPIGATPELLRPLDARLITHGTSPEDIAAGVAAVLEITGPAFRHRCRRFALEHLAWSNTILRWERALEDAAQCS